MLSIKNLKVEINGKCILNGFNLEIKPGEVHAIMGPNGSGKSTLSKVLAGDPRYKVTEGSITYLGKDLTQMEPEDRSLNGIFLAFQYPTEIPGVSNTNFLRMAYNARQKNLGKDEVDPLEFKTILEEKTKIIDISSEHLSRSVNHGFSGGEKKKNEILQMAILEPKLAILDETDSGLDIDALRVVSEGVNKMRSDNNSFIIITHYQRILNYIEPNHVHILSEGKIVKSGDKSLAVELETKGYDLLEA